ncbi:MAG TPA: hypothetical protein VKH44_01860 [Pirellulaceae bacterium]|nr:hypothetical protein [Pirellulaceae bacterium]
MNDRARAAEILRKARAILAERLTDKILEQREDLLDDARGDSYMSEIESLYEQVGMKLSHVGQMLSNLPAEEPQPQTHTAAAQHSAENTFTVATEPAPNYDGITQDTIPALMGPIFVAAPALPAPKMSEPVKHRATNSALQAFAAQIQAGDLLAAGRTLAMLFDVEEPRAVACAATFAQRVRGEAAFFRKVMELRGELHSSNSQRALLLLLDCFGLSRGESAEILRNMQRRRRAG